MAKSNTKASKPVVTTTETKPVKVRATRNRETVLVARSIQQLVDLLPGDTVIGVSRKSLLKALAQVKLDAIKEENDL